MPNETTTTIRTAQRIHVPGIFDRILNPIYATPPIKFFEAEWNRLVPIKDSDIKKIFKPCAVCGDIHSELELSPIFTGKSKLEMACDWCKKEYTRICDDCGSPVLFDHPRGCMIPAVGEMGLHKFVCPNCAKSNYHTCRKCGMMHGKVKVIGSDVYCVQCYNEHISTHMRCQYCGDWFPTEKIFMDGSIPLCQTCFIRKKTCTNPKEIKGYCKTKGIVFLATKGGVDRFYGLEIEGQNGKYPSEQPPELLQALSEFIEIELKEDGSVSRGFEIATYPMSLDWYKNQMKLPKLCSILNKYGFKSNDDPNAGFHVHISRDAFGNSPRKISKHLAGFTYLWHKPEFRQQIKTFTRRENKATRGRGDPYSYCKFFSTNYNAPGRTITKEYVNCVAQNKADRYTALNFHTYGINPNSGRNERIINDASVELRLFKGTTKRDTIIATLELIDLFADISITITDEKELRALTWKDICGKVPANSPELKAYLINRKIWEE